MYMTCLGYTVTCSRLCWYGLLDHRHISITSVGLLQKIGVDCTDLHTGVAFMYTGVISP